MSVPTPEQPSVVTTASALAATAHELATLTNSFDVPVDAYLTARHLTDAARDFAHALDQAAAWHTRTKDGVHFDAPSTGPMRLAALDVARDLAVAARHLRDATAALETAQAASAAISWRGRL